ncbi:PilW family protein [Aestuariibacter sp. AA17]|uniref:PilW family protein n=1 Tax=Fluctibacter corallii TaxID=2984329 RepID=A0ABT3A373_9ALTE|nr:PilW family protein [Aestuariibacter sp. AA17]MCV2883122.1 PilW family protein [Aestuariibacter sp. AA17]
MNSYSSQRGFTLIEIMITLTLGLVISIAVVQIMVSNNLTERLNRAMASVQENGRFIMGRLREDVLIAGRYDSLSPNLERSVDIVNEAAFLQNRPIIQAGDFVNAMDLGVVQGANGTNDELVIAMQSDRDCRGYKLGYGANEEFFVVNHYFVDGTNLKCRGFDGRVLRGLRAAVGTNGDKAFTLLDGVESFQVEYGVSSAAINADDTGRPSRFVTADLLPNVLTNGAQVVAIRIAILVKGEVEITLDPVPSFTLLNEAAFTPSEKRLYKKFEGTFALRNVKNFVRSRKL